MFPSCLQEYHGPGLCPQVLEAWRRAADMFEDAGAKVTQVSLPHTQYSILCYTILCCCEVASNFSRYDGIQYGKLLCHFKTLKIRGCYRLHYVYDYSSTLTFKFGKCFHSKIHVTILKQYNFFLKIILTLKPVYLIMNYLPFSGLRGQVWRIFSFQNTCDD